ncbi:MAG TPA: hypothetical protein VJN50_04505 [Actinomycetota bacterium]|nr:hypothetical protein [Actinomycetota bacterium]
MADPGCTHCGARLTPGMRWCWRCYTPIPVRTEEGAPEKEPSTDYVTIERGIPPRPRERLIALPDIGPPSGRGAGGTTFGALGKAAVTAVVVGLGAAAGWFAGRWVDAAGGARLAFVVLTAAIYSALAFLVLRYVWRPERPPSRPRARGERTVFVGEADMARTTAGAHREGRPVH